MALPKLDRPLVFFDLESTGLMIDIDRIIEVAALKIHPDGRRERYTQRFNPGIRVPVESVAIHGLTNEMLDGEPRFAEKAAELFEFYRDADLGGYNIMRFDVPMLTKEFDRAGYPFSAEGCRILDASVIFRDKERRNLTAAVKFYLGEELVGAHGAEADNEAAFRVFLAQLERYPDLPKDVEGLHRCCTAADPNWVDSDGKLVWRDGEAFFNFGKYRFHALAEVIRTDPGYLDWIVNKADFRPDLIQICLDAKRGVMPRRPEPKTA
jgi:DNA polymerase-3 subunit epsilon